MTISVRLDARTQSVLDRLARERGLSRSQIVRESLARFGGESGAGIAREPGQPYERVKHLIGCVNGPPDLASRAQDRVRQVIAARNRVRRPR
ncbi:MAG: ribbon-helix-helix protein, CopG family [Candidatus Coatesbacteria bacterium]